MESVNRTQLNILTAIVLLTLTLGGTPTGHAQTSGAANTAALSKSLQDVYLYWRNAIVGKNYYAWKQITASHRVISIQNRIVSEKGAFPADIFNLPAAPPALNGLKLLRARSKGVTAKAVYFGEIDFGVGGKPTDNLLVLSYVHEGRSWKYDSAEFVNLSSLKDVRTQLQAKNYTYIDGAAFMPNGVRPIKPIVVARAKYITKVYTYCPGREVKVSVNKISKHRFQDIQRAEVVAGGARDGMNRLTYTIKNLPGYSGDDPITIRVYLFSQIKGVKPVNVFQYQTKKGEKPKAQGSVTFNVSAAIGRRILGR